MSDKNFLPYEKRKVFVFKYTAPGKDIPATPKYLESTHAGENKLVLGGTSQRMRTNEFKSQENHLCRQGSKNDLELGVDL